MCSSVCPEMSQRLEPQYKCHMGGELKEYAKSAQPMPLVQRWMLKDGQRLLI